MICQYCRQDALTDEELAAEIKAVEQWTDNVDHDGGEDCDVCGG